MGGARHLDAADAIPRTQQSNVGTARNEFLDQHHIGRVIFDIQQRAEWRIGLQWRLRACGGLGCADGRLARRRQVQFDPEHAALAHRAFRADHAAHQFDQPLAYDQADAGAFLGACLLPEPIKRLKQMGEFFRRQAVAGVLDTKAYASRCAQDAVYGDRSVRLVVFDRVGQQVDEQLLHPYAVAFDKVGVFEPGKGHADAALCRHRLYQGLAFQHRCGQRHRLH